MMRKIATSILIILPFILFAFDKSNVSINPVYHTSQRLKVNPVSGAVKICALRVSFPEDDNDATTGNGKFLLRSDTGDSLCSPIVIDPPPHERAYFRDHIRAAANYFYQVSKGHAVIDTVNSEIYPLIDSLTFQVSQKMDYYHPFLQEDSIDVRLARLFRESVLNANSAGVDFSQYDIVIIFHAGVGQDFDLFLDPTPYDIPSAYLNLNDFRMAFAPDNPNYEGIAVENSSYFIKEGIILPETQNHLLFPNWEDVFGGATSPCEYQIGLNGTFAFMMGFYWGLPSLYDTETGETGIGKFGLMDQGSANLNGLVPAVPSAWSRVFLGWEDPVVAGVDQIINLRHVETSSDSLVWKVPINDYEYFLIENRYAAVRPGVSLDSIQYRIYLKNGEDEWPSIFPLIVDSIGAVFSEETGVLLSVSRYDVGLPGSGLLIWHIDESVINPNLSANRINVNRERRGVDLEEGDGAQDLGYPSQMLGASVDIGWFFDPWFAGNEGFWHLNPDYPEDEEKRVGFTDHTNPSSKSNDFAYTGICIDSIGPAGSVMEFWIRLDNDAGNFPISISSDRINPYLLSVNVNSSNEEEFIVIADSIYLFNAYGKLITNVKFNLPVAAELTGVPIISKKTIDTDAYLVITSSIGDSTSLIYVYELSSDGDVSWDNTYQLESIQITSNLLFWDNEIVFGTYEKNDGNVAVRKIDLANGILSKILINDLGSIPIRRLVGDENITFAAAENARFYHLLNNPLSIVDFDINTEYVTISDELIMGYWNVNDTPDIGFVFSQYIFHQLLDPLSDTMQQDDFPIKGYFGLPIFADIDGDGKNEFIVADLRQLMAFNEKLNFNANFPISIPNQHQYRYFEPYLLSTDVDGNGVLDILISINGVGIFSYKHDGDLISGFPKVLPYHQSINTLLLNTISGTNLITTNTEGNKILGVKLTDQELSPNAWYCYGGNSSRSFFYTKPSQSPTSSATGLLDQKKTFNWPNPTKFDRTAIRYFPTADCNIAIDIYDLAGDFITSFKDSDPLINDYNEIEWNVSNVESGVYFAVLKATSGSKIDSKIVKIMVIK